MRTRVLTESEGGGDVRGQLVLSLQSQQMQGLGVSMSHGMDSNLNISPDMS